MKFKDNINKEDAILLLEKFNNIEKIAKIDQSTYMIMLNESDSYCTLHVEIINNIIKNITLKSAYSNQLF